MKILHVLPSSYAGGSELCSMESIQALSELGYENYVVIPNEGEISSRLKLMNVSYSIISHNWWMSEKPWKGLMKWIMLKGFYSSARSIQKLVRDQSIDLVITHTIVIPSGALAARFSNVPHIWYLHEYGDLDHKLFFEYGKRITMKCINNFSKAIIVNSDALKTYFSNYFSLRKINRLYYAVNYPELPPLTHKSAGELSLCMVGRITKGKNQLVSLKALHLLQKEGIFPQMVFVGGSEEVYLKELKEYIQEKNLVDQVVFAGQIDKPWEFVSRSHAVLICSIQEAFGRVTVESMKAGRISVVAATGAGPELIDSGKNGYLFDPVNEHELSAILKKIWYMEDTSLVSEAAQTFAVNTFNIKKHGNDLSQIIQTL